MIKFYENDKKLQIRIYKTLNILLMQQVRLNRIVKNIYSGSGERMIEIKGKDGGALQLEVNYLKGVKYNFTYKNDNIFFICKDEDDTAHSLSTLRMSLEGLLKSKPKLSIIDEILDYKPDSWFRRQLKNSFPSWFKETYYNIDKCGFFSVCECLCFFRM